MKNRLDITEGVILSIVLFTILGFFVPGKGPSEFVISFLSISSFLFGIFAAFSISDRHSRFDEIRKSFKIWDASMLSVHRLSRVFGKTTQMKVQKLIDKTCNATFDYKLEDYYLCWREGEPLIDYILNLHPKNDRQKIIYEELVSSLEDSSKTNKEIAYLMKDKISRFEWAILSTLGVIILFCLFYINTNTYFSIFIIVLLSASLVTILLLLRDLDDLYWKEEFWVWAPTIEFYDELGLPPYFPAPVIANKRIKRDFIKNLKEYRVAHYPNPYPDMSGKKVKLVKNSKI